MEGLGDELSSFWFSSIKQWWWIPVGSLRLILVCRKQIFEKGRKKKARGENERKKERKESSEFDIYLFGPTFDSVLECFLQIQFYIPELPTLPRSL